MIKEKNGQIIVTELMLMSDAPTDGRFFIVFDGPRYGGITYWDGEVFSSDELPTDFNVNNMLGWLPIPIYQPDHIGKECEKCGARSAKEAAKICDVDALSDEVCPGNVIWG